MSIDPIMTELRKQRPGATRRELRQLRKIYIKNRHALEEAGKNRRHEEMMDEIHAKLEEEDQSD